MTQSIEQDQTESKSPFATVSLIDLNVPTRPLDMWDYRGKKKKKKEAGSQPATPSRRRVSLPAGCKSANYR